MIRAWALVSRPGRLSVGVCHQRGDPEDSLKEDTAAQKQVGSRALPPLEEKRGEEIDEEDRRCRKRNLEDLAARLKRRYVPDRRKFDLDLAVKVRIDRKDKPPERDVGHYRHESEQLRDAVS